MKKLLALLIALGMMVTSIGVLADTPQDAETLAKAQVPATALLTDTNSNNNRYEFTFEDRVARVRYRVGITKQPLSLHKITSSVWGAKGAEQVALQEEQANASLLQYYPQAEVKGVYVEKDEGRYHFNMVFGMGDDNSFYRAKLNAQTGDLMQLSAQVGTPQGAGIPLMQAVNAAMSLVPGADVVDVDYDDDDGDNHYEIKLLQNGQEIEVEVDARTGEVTRQEAPRAARTVALRNYRADDDGYLNRGDDDDDDWDDDLYDDDDDDDDRYDDDRDDDDDDDWDDDDDDDDDRDDDDDDDDDDRYDDDDDDDDDDDNYRAPARQERDDDDDDDDDDWDDDDDDDDDDD